MSCSGCLRSSCSSAVTTASAGSARPAGSLSFPTTERPMPPEPQSRPASEQDLIRAVWEEARDLIKKLEGSTVQRLRVEAGGYKIEIERGLASAPGVQISAP